MTNELKQTNENDLELKENIMLSIFLGMASVGTIWFSSILLTYIVTGRV